MAHAGGMSQADLARAMATQLHAEVDRSIVNKILLGKRKLAADEMFAIHEITDYPITVIGHSFGGAVVRSLAKQAKVPTESASKTVQVPVLDRVAAGKLKAPSSQIPLADVPLLAFADLGRGDFFALQVEGDSMDRISPDGSVIVVNQTDRTLVSGKPYVISQRGEATFKVWRSDPPRFAPYSTNPIHEPIFVKSKADAERMVIGRVKRTVLDL